MLGVLAVTGGLLYAGNTLGRPVELPEHTPSKFDQIRDHFIEQFDSAGLIAPTAAAVQGRVPWNPDKMPWTFYKPGKPMEFAEMYRNYANSSDHLHRVTVTDLFNTRQTYPHKNGGALVNAFSREFVSSDGRHTDLTNTSYYSRDPGAMDMMLSDEYAWNAPKNHRIAADAFYWTEPGLPFRYGRN